VGGRLFGFGCVIPGCGVRGAVGMWLCRLLGARSILVGPERVRGFFEFYMSGRWLVGGGASW